MKKIFILFLLLNASILNGCKFEVSNISNSQKEISMNKPILLDYEIDEKQVLEKIQNQEKIVIIDVREDFELEKTGVLERTIHIPLGSLSEVSLTKMGISKEDEIIIFCRTGNRSYQATKMLNSFGFRNVKSLQGGIVHWLEIGNPVLVWSSLKNKSLLCFDSQTKNSICE